MQTAIALRSPLLAAAAVAISASAITPSTPVTLTGFDSPLGELLSTISYVNNDLFNGSDVFGDFEWEPYQGAIPEFIYTALPLVTQLGYNGSAYIGGTIDALTTSAYILDQAVWNLPAALVTAAQQAIGGDIPGAITTLTNATVVPIQDAVSYTVNQLQSIVATVISNVAAVAGAIPGILQGLATTVVGGAQAIVTAVVNIATQTVGALSTGNFDTAWNTVVDGLLGPVGADGTVASSLAGTIENLTLGPGLVPLGNPNGYAVPSLRMWAEQSQLQIANAIGGNYPVPAAAVASKRAAKHTAAKTAAAKAAAHSGVTEKRRRG